jgi:cellulose synthase (UDP-forming)
VVQLDAPLFEVLAPLLFVIGSVYLLGPLLPMRQGWPRALVFVAVGFVGLRYFHWRLFTTVLPASGTWVQVGWVWLCFVVELFALFDALVLYLAFLRTSDHGAEADRHEHRLRAVAPGELPSVDVFIPTYDEPLEVLEKTIIGATCLDYPNFRVWVLDDGRRPWLKSYCEEKGVGYVTRPNNAHAKAGNINHALSKTAAEFVALFDADFVVQRKFLMRTLGFFSDPAVGVVQVPHAFYNPDPVQTNLAVRKSLPDDQRFFFEAIMPSRDAWNAAFCCGSNSVTRRAALRAIGDALPTDSITEDMLLTLKLLRKDYVTRYLCERLAYGLAPEGLRAFFIQRRRWARGAMQILYLRDGPFGPGLTLMQRLLFLPTHWLSQGLTFVMAILVPLVFLWTGLLPMVHVTVEGVISYIIPMVLAVAGGITLFAPGSYFPLAVQILGTFQSFKLLPSLLVTLVKPFGHQFKVTPKGAAARASSYDQEVFWTSAGLMTLTALGILINIVPEWQIVPDGALIPIVAAWAAYNMVVLFLVCMVALQGSVRRGEERFPASEPAWVVGASGARSMAQLEDISLSGALVNTGDLATVAGDQVSIFISEVGFIPARVVRRQGGETAVAFQFGDGPERDLLIRKLFTAGSVATTSVVASAWSATAAVLGSIWSAPSGSSANEADEERWREDAVAEAKLSAETRVVAPHPQRSWTELVAERRNVA